MDRLIAGKNSSELSHRGTSNLVEEKKFEVLTKKIRNKMHRNQKHPTYYTEMLETIQEVEKKVMIEPIIEYEEEEIKFNPVPQIPERLSRISNWDDFILKNIPEGSI